MLDHGSATAIPVFLSFGEPKVGVDLWTSYRIGVWPNDQDLVCLVLLLSLPAPTHLFIGPSAPTAVIPVIETLIDLFPQDPARTGGA